MDKLIQNRIDILREIVKKEKMDNKSESDSEEDEKLEDIAGRKNREASTHTQKKNIINNCFPQMPSFLASKDSIKI